MSRSDFSIISGVYGPWSLIFLYEEILKMQVGVEGFTSRLSYIPTKICELPVSGSCHFDSRMQHYSGRTNERRRGLITHNAGTLTEIWLGLLNIKSSIKRLIDLSNPTPASPIVGSSPEIIWKETLTRFNRSHHKRWGGCNKVTTA